MDRALPVPRDPERVPRRALGERFFRWRDRLIGSPAFQAWAARFPPTRPIARRSARRLFDLAAGFVYAQTLAACVRLDVFGALADGPRTTPAVARATGLEAERAERLMRAAASVGLVARTRDGRWRLTQLGAAVPGAPGVAAMVRHHALFYADMADPVALLRGDGGPTRLGAFWGYAGGAQTDSLAAEDAAAFSELMAASQPMVAAEVLSAYDFGRHRCLLDVGGGHGAFLAAVADRHPRLGLQLFDLPAVAGAARERVPPGTRVHGGDFLRDPLPKGADAISLVRILHDHDDAPVRRLLSSAHRALAPYGTLIVAEPMAGGENGRVGDAYFGFYLLAMGAGRPRSFAELEALLAEAGFRRIRRRGGGVLTRVVTAVAAEG